MADQGKNTGKKNRVWGLCFFPVLLAGLILLYYPTFKNPPRSDYWSAFYIFQQVESSPQSWAWTEILTFDLWGHGTYRPLSHLVPYLQHLIFSPDFIWNHVLNFAGYCLSIFLLYILACRLGLNRTITIIFLSIFAFLFSHSDILGWTFQLFSILGFCALLSGFILYLGYLRSKKDRLLFPVGVLFLFGMLCSEAYALWPLAIILLPVVLSGLRPRLSRPGAIMLSSIYLLYLGGFAVHRSGAVTTGPIPHPDAAQILSGVLLPFFNLFYNGLVVNLYPFSSLPLYYNDNMNLGGVLVELGGNLAPTALWTGAGVLTCLVLGLWLLAREKKRRELGIFLFLLFLYLSNFMVVSVARLITNGPLYPLSQFRYQYVPNALLALLAAAVFGRLFLLKTKGKFFLSLILLPVLVMNIAVSQQQITELGERLTPLRLILDNIQTGLDEGRISERDPLFISPEVPGLLPAPSWNKSMARFMEGNLQWFFPAEELGKFTMSPARATWTVTPGSLPAIRRVVPAGQ